MEISSQVGFVLFFIRSRIELQLRSLKNSDKKTSLLLLSPNTGQMTKSMEAIACYICDNPVILFISNAITKYFCPKINKNVQKYWVFSSAKASNVNMNFHVALRIFVGFVAPPNLMRPQGHSLKKECLT